MLGTEYSSLKAEDRLNLASYFGKNEIDFNNFAIFAQVQFKERMLGNITVGARYDRHSEFEDAFVPRFALTKEWEKFHLKFLASKAFRAPSVKNITAFLDKEGKEATIKPEMLTTFELELGTIITPDVYMSVNIFDIKIKDPIVYYYPQIDAYDNYERTGTRGFELISKYQKERFALDFSYSYYRAVDNKVDQYEVPDEEIIMLGFPSHKIVVFCNIIPAKNFIIQPSLIYHGKRYGATGVTVDDDLIIEEFDPVTLFNLSFSLNKIGDRNFDVNLSVFNIADEAYEFIEPYYDGYHAPLPGQSREIVLKVKYTF